MIDGKMKERMKLTVDAGAMIVGQMPHAQAIVPDSPADKAGLKEKDIITECNGEKLTTERNIQDLLEEREVGDTLNFKVVRGKKSFDAKVVLAERK